MISRCSSPIPEMTTSPVCGSVLTRKVGSSAISLPRPCPSFSWSALVFGSIASEMTGSGKSIDSSTTGVPLVADRVAGRDRLQADRRGDVAGVDFLDFLALVGVHLQQPAEALGLLLGRVVDRRPGGHDARVDADERELTDERVGHDLEPERRERRVVGRRPLDDRLRPLVRIEALDRRHVERRRQVVDDRVEQRLHALVLERRAADDRHERRLRLLAFGVHRGVDALAQRRLDLVLGDRLAVQVLLEQLVVRLADLLDQLLAVVRRVAPACRPESRRRCSRRPSSRPCR